MVMNKELSGRKLDAEIHVRVMGFPLECKLVGDGQSAATALHCEPPNAAWRIKSASDEYWDRWSPNGADRIIIAPPYHESIEAAMQVVEKLIETGWRSHISTHSIAPRWSGEMFYTNG